MKRFLVAGSLIAIVGVAVLAAQHSRPQTSTSHQPSVHHMQLLHAACAESGTSSQPSHVPAHMAKALELSAAQLTQIDQVATEACQEMKRIHERMMAILTPEQRAKVHELHKGEHSGGGIHEWLKRLHGTK